ncbi:DMT family transporter [Escherichia coli]
MQKIIVFLLFCTVALTWGTTWLSMRIAVETIPPLFATGMRFMFAAPFLMIISYVCKKNIIFPKGQRLFQFVITVFYFAIPFTMMIYSEIYVTSGLAAVIFSTMPVVVLIFSALFLREKVSLRQITGLSISMISLICIFISEVNNKTGDIWKGVIALVFALVCHAIIYTQCKKRDCSVSVITFNTLPCFFAGMMLLVFGYFVEKPNIELFSLTSVLATLYLGAFAGVFGILCYFELQKKAGAFQASLVFLVFPLIALTLEKYIYGDMLSFSSIFLVIFLIVGVFFTITPGDNSIKKQ